MIAIGSRGDLAFTLPCSWGQWAYCSAGYADLQWAIGAGLGVGLGLYCVPRVVPLAISIISMTTRFFPCPGCLLLGGAVPDLGPGLQRQEFEPGC